MTMNIDKWLVGKGRGHYDGPGRNPALLTAREAAKPVPVDQAFMRLLGAFSVKASYPEKSNAMEVAVKELGSDATANELYENAVQTLTKGGG